MDKMKVLAWALAALSAVLVAERAVKETRKYRKQKAEAMPTEWQKLWNKAEQLPYQTKWSGQTNSFGSEWDCIHLDSALKVGSIYSCLGPNGSKAIIVVTAVYGPLAIHVNPRLRDLRYSGNPTLGTLKFQDEYLFTNPVNEEWLGSILDPNSEIYNTKADESWKTVYETIEELKALRRDKQYQDERVTKLAVELADKIRANNELVNYIKQFESPANEDLSSFAEPLSEVLGSFGKPDLNMPVVNIESASIVFGEETETVETVEEVEVELTDPDIASQLETA